MFGLSSPDTLAGAACVGLPEEQMEWFFAEGYEKENAMGKAKRICNTQCPVREACLEWALDNEVSGLRFGVYGGMSARERDRKFPSYFRRKNLCRKGLHDMSDPENRLEYESGVRCGGCKRIADAKYQRLQSAKAGCAS